MSETLTLVRPREPPMRVLHKCRVKRCSQRAVLWYRNGVEGGYEFDDKLCRRHALLKDAERYT